MSRTWKNVGGYCYAATVTFRGEMSKLGYNYSSFTFERRTKQILTQIKQVSDQYKSLYTGVKKVNTLLQLVHQRSPQGSNQKCTLLIYPFMPLKQHNNRSLGLF